MSIKKWFSGKANATKNNKEAVKQLSIVPKNPSTCISTKNEQNNYNTSLLPDEHSCLQVSYVDGNDTQSGEQIAKEKSVRKFGLFSLWWKGSRNANQTKTSEGIASQPCEQPMENNQLLQDPSVLAFLESIDRRLNDRRLPLDKSDMVRLETFQAQAVADGCNELLDIIEYFEWENDRCLLIWKSAGPSKPIPQVACSS